MPDPVGLSEAEIIAQVAQAEALGEMQIPPLPPGKLQTILDKLRATLELKPSIPQGPP